MNIKQKVRKSLTNEYRYFLKSNFVRVRYVFVYSNKDDNAKRFKTRRYSLPKGIVDYYNVAVNGKEFYDQTTESDIKRCEEIRNLTTGQGEDLDVY